MIIPNKARRETPFLLLQLGFQVNTEVGFNLISVQVCLTHLLWLVVPKARVPRVRNGHDGLWLRTFRTLCQRGLTKLALTQPHPDQVRPETSDHIFVPSPKCGVF